MRVWDTKTSLCRSTLRPPQQSLSTDIPILAIALIPRSSDHLLVVPRGDSAFIMTLHGAVLRAMTHGKAALGNAASASAALAEGEGHVFVGALCVSPQGRWAYIGSADKCIYAFSCATGSLEGVLEGACDARGGIGITGLVHHPLRNLLCSIAADGKIRLWKPLA